MDITGSLAPVLELGEEKLEDGIALCLSGGGYRAMLFHLGSLWRLNEAGLLGSLDRVSSVSGGSITAAVLGVNWDELGIQKGAASPRYKDLVVRPVRKLASTTIDVDSVLRGIFLPGTVSDRVTKHYQDTLFDGMAKTLQDLPDDANKARPAPRFVINATSVQTGSLVRFSRPYIGDWRIGRALNPNVPLARAVAASSAFPPILSPCEIETAKYGMKFVPFPGSQMLPDPAFTSTLVLSDGGVYDNLGLETAWKRYKTLWVSDGGGHFQPEQFPHADWAMHSLRINDLIDSQVRALRSRQLITLFDSKLRRGSYWSIRQTIGTYANASPRLPYPSDASDKLANLKTRLQAMDDATQERLINWGYTICDASLRTHYDDLLPDPSGFPYPNAGW